MTEASSMESTNAGLSRDSGRDQRQKRRQIRLDVSLAPNTMKEANLSGVAEEVIWDIPDNRNTQPWPERATIRGDFCGRDGTVLGPLGPVLGVC